MKRGRKAINPDDKMQLVRIYEKKSVIDLIGEDKIKSECAIRINQLQSEYLTKCYDEALKSHSDGNI